MIINKLKCADRGIRELRAIICGSRTMTVLTHMALGRDAAVRVLYTAHTTHV